MKIQIFLLCCLAIVFCTNIEKIELDQHLSVEWEILNPSDPIDDQLVKFKLILEDASGWASIGWRLFPQAYVWGMAHSDYVVCYHNTDEDMACFDGFMGFKDEIAADGKNWNDYLPRPLPDSHPAVGGKEDITFLPKESFRHITDEKKITQWVFTRKINTKDDLDVSLNKLGIPSIYAYTLERSLWERDPENWELENIGAYHQQERGHWLFFLKPDHTGNKDEL